MVAQHHYDVSVRWTGAADGTTSSYRGYSREYAATVAGKPALRLSADGAFLGDTGLHNPEDLLVIALSGCHLLSYLAECARAGLHVISYADEAAGTMTAERGGYRFTEVLLRPQVTIAAGHDPDVAATLHERAHDGCFIARSVNFPVRHEARITVET